MGDSNYRKGQIDQNRGLDNPPNTNEFSKETREYRRGQESVSETSKWTPEATDGLASIVLLPLWVIIIFIFGILKIIWKYPLQSIIVVLLCGIGIGTWIGLQPCGWADKAIHKEGCGTVFKEHTGFANGITFSPKGDLLLRAGTGASQIYRVEDGALLYTISHLSEKISKFIFTPDGDKIIAATPSGTKIFTIQGKLLQAIDVPFLSSDVAISKDGNILAISQSDTRNNRVALYSMKSKKEQFIATNAEWLSDIDISPNNKFIATVEKGQIRVWAFNNKNSQYTIPLPEEIVYSAIFNHDSKSIFIDMPNHDVEQRSIETGTILHTFEGGNPEVSPDGQILATSSADNVYLWRIGDGSLLGQRKGIQGSVTFTPDGQSIAGETTTGAIQIWNINSFQKK